MSYRIEVPDIELERLRVRLARHGGRVNRCPQVVDEIRTTAAALRLRAC